MIFEINPAYQEILKLDRLLAEAGIPHQTHPFLDGFQVCYPTYLERVMDAVEHFGSYGHEQDRLEIMGLLTPKEKAQSEVLGYLSAEDVYARIAKDWKGRKEFGGNQDE